MTRTSVYATALAAAFAAFAMAGGIRASEKAVIAVEREEARHAPASGTGARLLAGQRRPVRDWRGHHALPRPRAWPAG
ncbi:MAG: hypothetical protein QM690_18585 [Sphingobium sp.]